ncbi:MAG: hypothetical protein ACOC93_02630, partial [Planctomycetota bacterium]
SLPITKFIGFAATALLVLMTLMAVKISLLDRLGGAAGFVSSFNWGVVLLALVTPWQDIFSGYAIGALTNLNELISQVLLIKDARGAEPEIWTQILVYARLLAYPIVALLVWALCQWRFRRGYSMLSGAAAAVNDEEPPSEDEGREDRDEFISG